MTRGKPLSFDRDEVLKSAMAYFWKHGYEATGMTDLLDHMGIQRQSFYNTFGSKEEVLLEAIELYGKEVRHHFSQAIDGASTPLEKIDRIFDMWAQMGAANDGNGCFLCNCIAEFGRSNDHVRVILDQSVEWQRDLFAGIFQEAIDRGDLPKDRDPNVLAGTLSAFSQGMALMSKTGRSLKEMNDISSYVKASLTA